MTEKKQKYERRKEVEDKTRNNNFAAALDYLKRQSGQKLYQKDLAEMLGVTENTMSNIIRYRTEVSEDMITQLQTISGGVFNLQWLRGQSDVMLAEDVQAGSPSASPAATDWASVALAAKDDVIAEKDARIFDLRQQIADFRQQVSDLRQQIADLRAKAAIEKGLLSTGRSRSESAEQHPAL